MPSERASARWNSHGRRGRLRARHALHRELERDEHRRRGAGSGDRPRPPEPPPADRPQPHRAAAHHRRVRRLDRDGVQLHPVIDEPEAEPRRRSGAGVPRARRRGTRSRGPIRCRSDGRGARRPRPRSATARPGSRGARECPPPRTGGRSDRRWRSRCRDRSRRRGDGLPRHRGGRPPPTGRARSSGAAR